MIEFRRPLSITACAIMVIASVALPAALGAQEPKEGDGRDLFVERCHTCHQLDTVTVQAHSADQWREIVRRMVMNGAQISDPESETIVTYLAKAYGASDAASSAPAGGVAHP